jgi:hypothetical protein
MSLDLADHALLDRRVVQARLDHGDLAGPAVGADREAERHVTAGVAIGGAAVDGVGQAARGGVALAIEGDLDLVHALGRDQVVTALIVVGGALVGALGRRRGGRTRRAAARGQGQPEDD